MIELEEFDPSGESRYPDGEAYTKLFLAKIATAIVAPTNPGFEPIVKGIEISKCLGKLSKPAVNVLLYLCKPSNKHSPKIIFELKP